MKDQDRHLPAISYLARRSRECLYECLYENPHEGYPLGAHFRVTRLGVGLSVTVSISSPAMEIGLSHTPKTTLATEIMQRMSKLSDLPLNDIDISRLNTAGTLAHFTVLEALSSHDLIEMLRQSKMETEDVLRLRS